MNYFEYRFTGIGDKEVLLAYLSQWPFESFMEQKNGLSAYLKEEDRNLEMDGHLISLINDLCFSLEIKKIESQNWNEKWEKHFDPVVVGDFCTVFADFHLMDVTTPHKIIVNPKMAFGTGHHETTYMMIEAMKDIDFNNKRVLDYGTGTGVLAILSEQLGADTILAIDNDEYSIENSLENSLSNNCNKIDFHLATIDKIDADEEFDIILANINRNVLLESATRLGDHSKRNSILLISGVLQSQLSQVIDTYKAAGFSFVTQVSKGNWSFAYLVKN